jgi:4-methyl-5(b-hydroxyethyl)-thiazole monophosphate biosynthesis
MHIFIGVFNEENYVDAPLVVDKQVLTAKGTYFVDFGIRLGRMLNLTFDPTWYR